MKKSFLSLKQPKEMYFLALTEMAQRFAFWGIGYLLVLYLVQAKQFTDTDADQLFGIFTGVAFVLPVLGGSIADRLGYRLPVIWGIFATALGCFIMALGNVTAIYPALGLMAIGAGIFTPSIYALLGTLYHDKHHLRESGFSIYYSAVNIGAFVALIILGEIGQAKSWNAAFILAGLVQLLGIFPFYLALKTIPKEKISPIAASLKRSNSAPLHKQERQRIYVICILSFFSILFWMAYNQGGSSMNLFALRYTDRNILGFQMPPSWLLSSEGLYLILFAIPLAKLYTFLAKRKMDPTPPLKSALSLFAIGLCFLIMTVGALQIPSNATSAAISPVWLFSAYAFMALGEMLIAPIGLSLITHLSPRRFTAMLVGIWYLCIGIAFYLGGAIAPFMSSLTNMSTFFGMFVVISIFFGLLLLLLIKKLNQMRHLSPKDLLRN